MLTSFVRQNFDIVIFATRCERPKDKVKYSTVKCKHFSVVLVSRDISVESYKEFKGVNFYSMRAMAKELASFERQRIELAFICILMAQ